MGRETGSLLRLRRTLAFAVADGRSEVWLSELVIAAVFITAAVLGFKRNPWIAVLALGGHGVMDVFHHLLVHNEGVPRAWPGFCMSFDVTAAVLVAGLMLIRARDERTLLSLGLR